MNSLRKFFDILLHKQPVETPSDPVSTVVSAAVERVKIAANERHNLIREVLDLRENNRKQSNG